MTKKQNSKQKQSKAVPRFAIGDAVRVKKGMMDYQYPDIPIGGWVGIVKAIHEDSPTIYQILWNKQTLDRIPPVYRNRCDRDGLDYEAMGVTEEELEPYDGGPIELEQPTKIITRPLNLKDEDDRIRAVFELTSDDPVPESGFEALAIYRSYLAKHLTFPFEAEWESESGPFSWKKQNVSVLGLGDPDEDCRIDETYGLICQIKIDKKRGDAPLGELTAKKGDRNRQLVEDYSSWFVNY